MVLLKALSMCGLFLALLDLHSSMVLLKAKRKDSKQQYKTLFTFQYGSIKSYYRFHPEDSNSYLHSSMVLLKVNENDLYVANISIYIPVWFY